MDRYADGLTISVRRREKALALGEALAALFPAGQGLTLVDFGCADGAVPVLLLSSPVGERIARITGITLLNYNDLPEKAGHTHPRFTRLVGDLAGPLDGLDLPWGAGDAVLATAFLHYLADPKIALRHACRLLKPGGYLLAGLPARGVLALRRHGVPGLLPRNNYLRTIISLDAWGQLAASRGLEEVSRQAIQWFGLGCTAPLERWLRRGRRLAGWGSNYLVVYRKTVSGVVNSDQ
ncbi:MAG: class I SAM-dependent methyltransferase [Armatimonadota bacterium]